METSRAMAASSWSSRRVTIASSCSASLKACSALSLTIWALYFATVLFTEPLVMFVLIDRMLWVEALMLLGERRILVEPLYLEKLEEMRLLPTSEEW